MCSSDLCSPRAVLDLATGSGDVAFALSRQVPATTTIVGADFCQPMLDQAEAKKRAAGAGAFPNVAFCHADALNLPFADASFDAVTIAFGLRNLAEPIVGLREMRRVVRRRAVVLEFVRPPEGVIGGVYRLYLRTLLPALGGAISGQPAAYRYLSDTVDAYRTPEELLAMAKQAGYSDVRIQLLAMGTVAIVSGGA